MLFSIFVAQANLQFQIKSIQGTINTQIIPSHPNIWNLYLFKSPDKQNGMPSKDNTPGILLHSMGDTTGKNMGCGHSQVSYLKWDMSHQILAL